MERSNLILRCQTVRLKSEWVGVSLHCSNTLDFDDLISLSNAVLRDRRLAARMSDRYRHILVDEFQDTNAPQYEFVRLLAAAGVRPSGAKGVDMLM
jgi:superfamily I DNA/RNA helicase